MSNVFLYGKSPEAIWDHINGVVAAFIEHNATEFTSLTVLKQEDYLTISVINGSLEVLQMFYISDSLDVLQEIKQDIDPDNCIIEEKIILAEGKIVMWLCQGAIVSIKIDEDMTDDEFLACMAESPFPSALHGCEVQYGMFFEERENNSPC